jgi:beta-aspartyl-dipeptidase (metallo-type)
VEWERIDARGCIVCPGLIDAHEHIMGGSGERGFRSMTPELFVEEIVQYGITTVVGCLGVDVTMKNMAALVGKAKSLREHGLETFVWTGGYHIPPATLTRSVREDILFVDEIIGLGEIAISDRRSMDPDPKELARLAHDAYDGGMLAGKCGLTHFHVGEHEHRLRPLFDLVDNFSVEACWLYPTHVERNEALMREAIDLSKRGTYVDVDIVEEDLSKWLRFYLDNGGNLDMLTVSSDAAISSPRNLYEQMRTAFEETDVPLEDLLSLATSNTARALAFDQLGTLEEGKRGNLVILEEGSLDIISVHTSSGWMVRDGTLVTRSAWLDDNKRQIHLVGARSSPATARQLEMR